MFDNIGSKLKNLALIIFSLEIIGFACLAVALFDSDGAIGLIPLIGGPIFAWVNTSLLYGFGELIERTTEIANNTKRLKSSTSADSGVSFECMSSVESIRDIEAHLPEI